MLGWPVSAVMPDPLAAPAQASPGAMIWVKPLQPVAVLPGTRRSWLTRCRRRRTERWRNSGKNSVTTSEGTLNIGEVGVAPTPACDWWVFQLLLYRYRLAEAAGAGGARRLAWTGLEREQVIGVPALQEPRWAMMKSLQLLPSGEVAGVLAMSGPLAGSVPPGKNTRSPEESVVIRSGCPSLLRSPALTGVAGFHGT